MVPFILHSASANVSCALTCLQPLSISAFSVSWISTPTLNSSRARPHLSNYFSLSTSERWLCCVCPRLLMPLRPSFFLFFFFFFFTYGPAPNLVLQPCFFCCCFSMLMYCCKLARLTDCCSTNRNLRYLGYVRDGYLDLLLEARRILLRSSLFPVVVSLSTKSLPFFASFKCIVIVNCVGCLCGGVVKTFQLSDFAQNLGADPHCIGHSTSGGGTSSHDLGMSGGQGLDAAAQSMAFSSNRSCFACFGV